MIRGAISRVQRVEASQARLLPPCFLGLGIGVMN